MSSKPAFISHILETNPLVEYLETQGHSPARSSGHRIKYICPIHGPEKEPSFYVFTDKEPQNYHCFGCGAHGDVINMAMALENLSLKEAIRKFADGIDFKRDVYSLIEESAIELDSIYGEDKKTKIEELAYRIGRNCYYYLDYVEFEKLELQFIESVLQKVDQSIYAMDEEALVDIDEFLADKGLPARTKLFNERKEREMARRFNND